MRLAVDLLRDGRAAPRGRHAAPAGESARGGFPLSQVGVREASPWKILKKIEGLRCILAQSRVIIQVKTAFDEDGRKKISSDVIFYSDFAKFCISY